MVHVYQGKNPPNLESHCAEKLAEAVVTRANMFDRDVYVII